METPHLSLATRDFLRLKPTYEEWKQRQEPPAAFSEFSLKPTYEEWKPWMSLPLLSFSASLKPT